MRRKKSLLINIGLIFTIFSLIVLSVCSFTTYANQDRIYKEQLIGKMQGIGDFICRMMEEDGAEFIALQDYILEHGDKLRITENVSGWEVKEEEFFSRFHNEFPGRTLEVDMSYDELPEDLHILITEYNYQYWMNMLQDAMDKFDIEYAYYLTPVGNNDEITYILDVTPETFEENGVNYRKTGVLYPEPRDEHKALWRTWETGKTQDMYDSYDNECGHTYAYYSPLLIDGVKLGLVGAEVTVEKVNKDILRYTLMQTLHIGLILFISMAVLLFIVDRLYIRKIESLSANVRKYAESKNADIASVIENEAGGNDEIGALANQTAAMILELDNYMLSLFSANKELSETREQSLRMNELSSRDALTGIRNKAAYDDEMRNLEWKMTDGLTDFGIAITDLNNLKQINNNYGHEKGNIAIKALCSKVCEVFEHSPVFRVGGDEFAIVLTGHDFKQIDELIDKFCSDLDALKNRQDLEPWETITAAIGYAGYDVYKDNNLDSVCKRAQSAMFEMKRQMHAAKN